MWSIDAGNSPNIYWSGYLSDIATSFVYDTPGIAHYQDEKGKHHIYVTGFTDGSDAFVTKIDQ